MKFTIFKDKTGEFRFRIVANNGNVLASSQGYKAKASARGAIDRIRSDASGSHIIDETALPA